MTEARRILTLAHQDFEWFSRNIDEIKENYENMFIAFENKKIIETAKTLNELLEKLKKNKVDTTSTIIEFISKTKTIL